MLSTWISLLVTSIRSEKFLCELPTGEPFSTKVMFEYWLVKRSVTSSFARPSSEILKVLPASQSCIRVASLKTIRGGSIKVYEKNIAQKVKD